MKIIYLYIFLFLFSTNIYAQIFQDDFCAYNENIFSKTLNKEPWRGNNDFFTNYLQENSFSENKIYYRVPLTFWLYKDNKGRTGATELDIKKNINLLNYYFISNEVGIVFYLSEIIKINKTRRTVFGYYFEAPLVTTINRNKESINIHFVNILQKNKIRKKTLYYKGTYNNFNKSIIIVKYNTKSGLTHEMGHYFNLHHPHKNWDKGKFKQEAVNRELKKGLFKKKYNCEINGDGLSDTPAEPVLLNNFQDDCTYTGDLTDNWGDKYRPATNNIMSYQRYKSCREIFTEQQKIVMLYTAKKNRNNKGWSSKNLQYNFDNFEPDNTKAMYNEINLNVRQYHTLHKTYKGKHKEDTDNDIDYLRFNPKTDSLKQIEIIFSQGKYSFPKIQITITNELNKIISQQLIKEECSIILDNILNRNYYIRIEKIHTSHLEIISDYFIEIK